MPVRGVYLAIVRAARRSTCTSGPLRELAAMRSRSFKRAMTVKRFRPVLLRSIFILVSSLIVVARSGNAAESGGQILCESRYALCSSALCKPISGNSAEVSCACEGPLNGLNIANSSCKARTDSLTSTFSLHDPSTNGGKAAKSALTCAGNNANVWAFCLDAPCTIENGAPTCRCMLQAKSDFYTFADTCPANVSALRAACGQIWSGASRPELESGFSQLVPFFGYPPKLEYCQAL